MSPLTGVATGDGSEPNLAGLINDPGKFGVGD